MRLDMRQLLEYITSRIDRNISEEKRLQRLALIGLALEIGDTARRTRLR
jgi:hypothetical protein